MSPNPVKNTLSMYRSNRAWRKIQFNKMFWIAGIWILLAFGQMLYEYAVRQSVQSWDNSWNLPRLVLFSSLPIVVISLAGSALSVFFFEPWIRSKPYLRALIYIILTYTGLFIASVVIGETVAVAFTGNSEGTPNPVRSELSAYFGSISFVKNYIVWFVIVILTSAGLVINDKYGPGILRKVLLGKYFKPHLEKRIFMFLDLRGSTEIAEKLSELKYFELLKELIEDVTQPILYTRGEVYQYVGDEVVVSWNMKLGRKEANCIRCFFEIQTVLKRKAPHYKELFGVVPEFKAGLHCGEVLAGEIGVVKRDVTYTGDVLNTTSRIQSMCNSTGVDLLLSKQLLDAMRLSPHQFHPKRIGELELRGKSERMVLYTL